MSCAPLKNATSFGAQLQNEPACIRAEPECHYTDSEPSSQCQNQDEASSSRLLLWSFCWWSICNSTQRERTHYCRCSLQSTSSPSLPSPAPQTGRPHLFWHLGWKPSLHTSLASSVHAAMLVSADLFLQKPSCPYTCWWSVTGLRIEAAAQSRSIFSKHETDQKTPSCVRPGWLWGLSPDGWSSGPAVDLLSECAGLLPQESARSLWQHVSLRDMT